MPVLPAGFEWIFIVLIVVVVFFGAKKLPEMARSFGRATTEYEKARIEAKKEIEKLKGNDSDKSEREKLESVADTLGINYKDKNTADLKIAIDSELNKNTNSKKI